MLCHKVFKGNKYLRPFFFGSATHAEVILENGDLQVNARKICSINFEPPAVPLNEYNLSAIMALSCQSQIFMAQSYTQCLPKIAQRVKDNS